jgi:hypothetical protein
MKELTWTIAMMLCISLFAQTGALATENNAAVNFTFDESNALAAAVSGDIEDTVVSEISYHQGTSASGGGYSEVAYESNEPEDNLFAMSSRDISGPHYYYQIEDSRLEFSLTAGENVFPLIMERSAST